MKKFTTLLACLFSAVFLVTSCSKDDANISSTQSDELKEVSEGNVKELLENISSAYGYGSINVNDEGTHYGASGSFGEIAYKFFSTETEMANSVIKMSVYFADVDSTFFMYSNPDLTVNKITFRGLEGYHLDGYRNQDFQDLYYLSNEKVVSDLEVTGIDPGRTRALTLALAYTFAPQHIGQGIAAPSEPVNPTFKVRVRRDTVDAAQQSYCADPDCVVRDGFIRMGRVFLVWWHCAC